MVLVEYIYIYIQIVHDIHRGGKMNEDMKNDPCYTLSVPGNNAFLSLAGSRNTLNSMHIQSKSFLCVCGRCTMQVKLFFVLTIICNIADVLHKRSSNNKYPQNSNSLFSLTYQMFSLIISTWNSLEHQNIYLHIYLITIIIDTGIFFQQIDSESSQICSTLLIVHVNFNAALV